MNLLISFCMPVSQDLGLDLKAAKTFEPALNRVYPLSAT